MFNLPIAETSNQGDHSPRSPVDARSFGSSTSQSGDRALKVLRVPSSLRALPKARRSGSSNFQGGRRPAFGKNSASGRPQVAGPMRTAGRPPARSKRNESLRREVGQDSYTEEEEIGNDAEDEEIKRYYYEKMERERPKAVHYSPQEYCAEKLKPTWPSLPTGEAGNASGVLEKISWMGGRLAEGFEPTEEIAKRVYHGEKILFKSDEEKTAVMERVQKMAAEKADKLTERKGQVVKAEDVSFNSLTQTERKDLLDRLVLGKYPELEEISFSPIVMDVLRNLRNNETYQATQAAEFTQKISKMLPPVKKTATPRQNKD